MLLRVAHELRQTEKCKRARPDGIKLGGCH
jgi:hypothetical protein